MFFFCVFFLGGGEKILPIQNTAIFCCEWYAVFLLGKLIHNFWVATQKHI